MSELDRPIDSIEKGIANLMWRNIEGRAPSDGAITIENSDIYPGATRVHLWYLKGEFQLDIVYPDRVVSKPLL
ncbi:MAG: hypothetical protein ACHQUA_00375 [Microgenomates group bacterium]